MSKKTLSIGTLLRRETYSNEERLIAKLEVISSDRWVIPFNELVGKTFKILSGTDQVIIVEEVKYEPVGKEVW